MSSTNQFRTLCAALILLLVPDQPYAQEVNSLGMKLRLIEGGRFIRGYDGRERGLGRDFPNSVNSQFFGNAEYPAHFTWITKPFLIAECEVTVGQWKAFTQATGHVTTAEKSGRGIVGWSPTPTDKPLYQSHDFERKAEFTWQNPGFDQADDHPVVGVSFEDVSAFLKWLSEKEGETYRLPTEAEWEFACRAGTETHFSFGNQPRRTVHRYANIGNVELEKHRKHSVERQWLLDWETDPEDGYIFTAPVGSKEANPLGLHDMHGNVWEWCADLWLDTFYKQYDWPKRGLPRGIAVNPVNQSEPQTESNQFRSIRGGCWYNGPIICRTSNRTYWDAPDAACYIGFRVVKEPDTPTTTKAAEAYQTEVAAREAITNFAGNFYSDRGLNIEIRFENSNPFDPAVCEHFDKIPGLEKLSLGGKGNTVLSTANLEAISRCPELRRLIFRSAFSIADADLSVLAKLPQFEQLEFPRSMSLNDSDLAKLKDLTTLTTFDCNGNGGLITDTGISHLKGNRNLATLNLWETDATGAFLADFTGCPLTRISITNPYNREPQLTDTSTAYLNQFPQLESVHFNGQTKLTEASIAVIGELPNLESLTLAGCSSISRTGFAPLKNLQRLVTINLQGTTADDEAIQHLVTIPRLEGLRLGHENISDQGIKSISGIFSLRDLYIESSSMTDAGLKYLGRINRLERLDIGSEQITGSGLGPITLLPNLKDLRLRCPGLTDIAFDHLSRGKNLRKIRLVERGYRPPAGLSNEGIMKMAGATWLSELWLPRNDSGITEAAIKQLDQLMPKTGVIPYTVEWNDN